MNGGLVTQLILSFIGAAKEVTGSKTLVRYKNKSYLVDCGLYQGDRELRQKNWEDFPHPESLDAVILTHAHIDHCGYLPRLVKQGFRGHIYCTKATQALVTILLTDAAHLEEEDAEYANRKGFSSHRPALPLFTIEDVEKVTRQIRAVERDVWKELSAGLSFQFLRSGHILGSSFVQLSFNNGESLRTVTFSGDLGSDRSHIIKGPVSIRETDYLILEGTYGDKIHRTDNIEKTIIEVVNYVQQRRGVLLIPAFAVGRTQELLFIINKLQDEKKISKIPLYVDSPMALKTTEIYSHFVEDLKLVEEGHRFMTSMEDSHYKSSTTSDQSKRLTQESGPMIVISAAGMLTGGRILHHLKARLPHTANAVLFVGFQPHGTKGRLLQNGIDRINIHHEEILVNAMIKSVEGLSAHADSREIINWVKGFSFGPKRIFLNHGERDPLKALKYRIQNELNIAEVEIPFLGEEFILD